jgi:ATP adenylyltransferase
MDTLWAPWRVGYVTGEKPDGCIFCIKSYEDRDADNFILQRGRTCFVVMNIYPYNNGHLMVVPYMHVPGIEDLPSDVVTDMMTLAQKGLRVLRAALHPSGFNIGINQGSSAGAGVADHVHMHVVPRWIGDTNFMPVIGDTRVMPQSLESCYDLLVPGFSADQTQASFDRGGA